ncbi:hypothetical protein [Hoyosella altamirensis]|uniref:Uncharacterized protein n=1 Tax=Hoyosella altamirensis TaxID=616997 RepID=A0A839RMI6_9ACTN|nr:hypothetical protein [Hoyosella altamirensis]MBB3037720.1 hypothetical protein [Hoyosella altamirensis]
MKSLVRPSALAFSVVFGASAAALGASGTATAQVPVCSSGICTVTFDAAGTEDFEVPEGVTVINVTAVGARGGGGGRTAFGPGAAGGDAGQDGGASDSEAEGGRGAVGTIPGAGGAGSNGSGAAGGANGTGGIGANAQAGAGNGGGGGGGGLVGGGGGGAGTTASGAGGGGGSSTGPAIPADEPARVTLTYVDPDFVPDPPEVPGIDFGSIEDIFS